MQKIQDLSDLIEEGVGPFPATENNINLARRVAFDGWRLRAFERGLSTPDDLSFACKFCSLFARALFGGEIRGNEFHQYLVLPNKQVLDLGHDSHDIKRLASPYTHDPVFWCNQDHLDSMESCLPRVGQWVTSFYNDPSRDPRVHIDININHLLNFIPHPYDGCQWEVQSFDEKDIEMALKSSRREHMSFQLCGDITLDGGDRPWHLARIAQLIEEPVRDAIVLSTERISDDEFYIDVKDGFHRLAAMIFSGENLLQAEVAEDEVEFLSTVLVPTVQDNVELTAI